jgi:hypothetical protein
MSAFPIWLVVSTMTIQISILLYGALRFSAFLSFCRSVNSSGNHEAIKNILILLMYSFGPLVIICVTFSWIAYYQGWIIGAVFCFIPFAPILLMIITVLITKNDISNMVDVTKKARTKLPGQGPAAFLTVVPKNLSPPRPGTSTGPPVLPIQGTPIPPRTQEL